MHFVVTGKTAAELIHERADSENPAMGLTTWKDAPSEKVLKGDILHDTAMEKASKEYEAFRIKQDQEYVSEFDREVERYLKGN